MAVAAWDLLTFADVKDYLNIGVASADTAQDVWLQEVLSDVSRDIEISCRRKIAVQSITGEIYDGSSWRSQGTNRIYTVYAPITQLSTEGTPSDAQKLASVQYRDDPDSAWTDLVTDVDHLIIGPDYIEAYDAFFPLGSKNIKLSYKAGYSTIPQDLKMVCLEMVAMVWKESNRSGIGLLGESSKSSSGLGSSVTRSLMDLNPRWEKVLGRYRMRA